MRRVVVVLCVAGWLAGCGGDGGSGGGGASFCTALGAASTCEGAEQTCREVLTVDAAADSRCVPQRDLFLSCLARHELVCASSSLLYAGPDAATGSSYFLGGYTVQTATDCVRQGDAWQSCLNCTDAVVRAREAVEGYLDQTAPHAPTCEAARDEVLACALPAQVTCPDGQTVEAGGTAETGHIVDELDNVTLYVTEACRARVDAWLDCVHCGQGVAFGKPGKEIGESCRQTAECAEGLTCALDHCTAPCDRDAPGDVCSGRRYVEGECRNRDGRVPSCGLLNACVISCEGNDDCTAIRADGFCPGNGAILEPIDNTVQYGACYFGPCDDYDCTATDPFP